MSNMASYPQPESEAGGGAGAGFIGHIPAILWQRRWLIIIPFFLVFIGSVAAALLLPPVYQSAAVMLVQSPQLPEAVTGGETGEIVDRRIARIRQQVTSRLDLLALIEKYNLYDRERASRPLSEVVSDMRDAIALVPTQADVPAGQADQRTVAFRLSFDYHEPGPAQQVTQALMERILQLDTSGNSQQVSNTVQFLTDQSNGLQQQISALQDQIGEISLRNGRVLGGGGALIMGSNAGGYDMQIAQLQRENAGLMATKRATGSADTRNPAVAAAESQLAAARAIYSETHPDVVIAKSRLAEAKALAKTQIANLPTDTIDDQIAFNNAQIAQLRAAKAQEVGQMSTALAAQSRAPAVQQQLTDLQQRLSGLNEQYQTVSDRLMAARAGERAENQQMGERLLVADPPVLPDKPVSPDRPLLAGIGLVGGLGLGIVFAFAVEMLLGPVRDPAQLASITGQAPLGIVPVIKPKASKRKPWRLLFWKRQDTEQDTAAAE